MIFEKEEKVEKFFDYLNSKHDKIEFTVDKETQSKLPFLDILLKRYDTNKLDISIYRKPTYTGLGTNFLSAFHEKYKTNIIFTFLHRAFSLSSSYLPFHKEIEFLKKSFNVNGYSENIFYKYVKRFLNSKFNPKVTHGPNKQ